MSPKRRQRQVFNLDPERVMDAVRSICLYGVDGKGTSSSKITHAAIMKKLRLSGGSGGKAGYKLTAVLTRLRKERRLAYDSKHGWCIP